MKVLVYPILAALLFIFAETRKISDTITLPNGDKLEGANVAVFNNKTYYFLTTFLGNWYSAYRECREIGANAIAIQNQEENDFLQGHIAENGWTETNQYVFWTSATKLGDTTFKWFSTAAQLTFTSWAPGQPDSDVSKLCLQASNLDDGTFGWSSSDCGGSYYVICESDDDDC